ncbi:MAG: type III secretion system chaperone [Chromatiaceae bacterium]|nr:type III secretion system chaperone [Chromatiaceae bacterium]MCP5315877.1 type III secretion system chaperone [Chromatiaceae bacterium]
MTSTTSLADILRRIDPGLVLDGDGECQIETDGGEECLISAVDETGQVVLSAPLVAVSDFSAFGLFQEALLINNDLTLTGAARICFDPDQGMLLLRYATAAEGLDEGTLEVLIDATLELAERMQVHLQAGESLFDPDGEPAPAADHPGTDIGVGANIIRG